MTAKHPIFYRITQGITLLALLIGVGFSHLLVGYEVFIAAAMIVVLGIPHGATDHLIFVKLSRSFLGAQGLKQFYFYYIALIIVYGIMWWLLPTLALGIFLIISIYHFGQSNWNHIVFSNKIVGTLSYLNWGSFVLFVPLLWHYDTTSVIISDITSTPSVFLSQIWCKSICVGLFVLNIWFSIHLWNKNTISSNQLINEILNLVLLGLVFINLPLLLGFTVYFVFWHSAGSLLDQFTFFQTHIYRYTWKQFCLQMLPFTLVAIAALGCFLGLSYNLGLPLNIGMLFIFISIVTLPHILLIDLLYEEKKEQLEVTKIQTVNIC